MAEIDTSKLKGDASCHVLSEKGRDNYDRIFGRNTWDQKQKLKKQSVTTPSAEES